MKRMNNFYFCSFDHVSNHQIKTTLVRNVQGVLKDNEYNPSMIKSMPALSALFSAYQL